MPRARSQLARIDVQVDTPMTSHTASDHYESQGDVPDNATSLDMDGGSNKGECEDEIPEEATMDGTYSSLVSLTPTWFQLSIYGVSVRYS